MTRVLHVISTFEVGGGAEHLIHLVHGLAGHGYQSSVVVGRDGPATARLRATGTPVEVLGPLEPTAPLALASRIARATPELIHLHGSRAGLYGAIGARLARRGPVLYTAHAFSFSRRMPAAFAWLAARAESVTCGLSARVICLTRGDLETARARGISTRNFTLIPNGIDIARFPAREDRRSEFGFGPGTPVVGMLARLVPQKDPVTFVRMAQKISAEMPEARFLLVGDGPLRAEVEAAGADLVRDRRLVVTGFRSDVAELIATMDVMVFPSLWEGLPLALLEAMSARRAVVASQLPGHAEVIEPGVTGLLIAAGEPARFAAEVATLLRDPGRREALGSRARAQVERCYAVERMVSDTVRAYEGALAEKR